MAQTRSVFCMALRVCLQSLKSKLPYHAVLLLARELLQKAQQPAQFTESLEVPGQGKSMLAELSAAHLQSCTSAKLNVAHFVDPRAGRTLAQSQMRCWSHNNDKLLAKASKNA